MAPEMTAQMARREAEIRARFTDQYGVKPEQHLHALDPSHPLLDADDAIGFLLAVHHDRQAAIHRVGAKVEGSGDYDLFLLALFVYDRLTADEHAAVTALDALERQIGFESVDDFFGSRVHQIRRTIPRPKDT
jgi:hypothetical protein